MLRIAVPPSRAARQPWRPSRRSFRIGTPRAAVLGLLLAFAPGGHAAAGGCEDWRVVQHDVHTSGDAMRVTLDYRGPYPEGADWHFYGLALPHVPSQQDWTWNQLDREHVRPLHEVRKEKMGKQEVRVYALEGWYRKDEPLVLYLVRRGAPHPHLAALAGQVEPTRPPRLRPGQYSKFHGNLLEKRLLLHEEPAQAHGLEDGDLVCRVSGGS